MFEIFQRLVPLLSLGNPSKASLFRLTPNSFKEGVAKVRLPLGKMSNGRKLLNLDFSVDLVRAITTQSVSVLAATIVTKGILR